MSPCCVSDLNYPGDTGRELILQRSRVANSQSVSSYPFVLCAQIKQRDSTDDIMAPRGFPVRVNTLLIILLVSPN